MSDPFSINGGSVVALVGKDCVGIACDLRLGQQAMTLSTDFPKIFPMGDKVFLGLAGLATDVQTLYVPQLTYHADYRNELFRFKTNMYRLREERSIEPKTLAHLVSSTLYEKRSFLFIFELMVDSVLISLVPLSLVSILRQMYRISVDSIILGVSTCLRRLLSLERLRNSYMECWRLYTNQILNLSNSSRL